jgi:predicted ATP-grasp superfamily ATP-dependent carboligase
VAQAASLWLLTGWQPVPRGGTYFQEHVEGMPAAALYCAAAGAARLLGLTRQFVGEGWLHAPAFGYCGSIGPLPLPGPLEQALTRLGDRLAAEGGLRGLFGVDGILRDGEFWTVEINPRYTASVEVLEHATGLRALHLHRLAFEDEAAVLSVALPARADGVVGKAILYAAGDVLFPEEGPWREALTAARSVEELPAFADVPRAGERIAAGRPVLTVLARSAGVAECLAALRARSAEVAARLPGCTVERGGYDEGQGAG